MMQGAKRHFEQIPAEGAGIFLDRIETISESILDPIFFHVFMLHVCLLTETGNHSCPTTFEQLGGSIFLCTRAKLRSIHVYPRHVQPKSSLAGHDRAVIVGARVEGP
jgi:hypothetical protein